MNIVFNKSELQAAIVPALCAVSERNTITAIEGIYFETDGFDKCVICSYDMEKGIREVINCKVENEDGGTFIINAAKLSRIIRVMPDEEIRFEIDEKNLCRITSGISKFELHCLPGSDFPSLPMLRGNNSFKISQGKLKSMISEIQFAIAVNDQRNALNGAYFEINEDRLKIVSCNGNMLAMRDCKCEINEATAENGVFDLRFIVPGKTLAELLKLISDTEDTVDVVLTRKHIMFFFENMTFFSRLIDTEYIDYNRVIRKESPITVSLSCAAFVSSLERTALVTEDKIMGQARSSVKCHFEGDILRVSATNIAGSVTDELSVEHTGDDLLIGFNNRYLLEALRSCPQDSITLSLATPVMSMQIEGADKDADDSFLYMVLPVKMA